MKTRSVSRGLALLAASGLTIAGCGTDGSDDSSGGDGPTVAAAFYPLAYVAEQVGGDLVTVENLTEPGVESHDLELTGRQVGTVADADLALHLAGYQPAVDAAVEQNATGSVLDVASVAELIDDDHDGEHDHGDLDGDPHLWLDPANMVAMADAVADQLAEIDPDNAEAYRSNAAELTGELETLDGEFTDGLAQCERSMIVVSHEAFGYLTHRYGLDQLGVAGLDPDAEPSPARVAEVHGAIADAGVTTVFYERLSSPAVVESLATDLDLDTAVLDPVEGLTDETADEDYLSLMRENLDAIQQANGCE